MRNPPARIALTCHWAQSAIGPTRAPPLSPLASTLREAILRHLDFRVAVAFSGGLDPTTLATVASQQVETLPITVCMAGSLDVQAAKEAADALSLPLHLVRLDEAKLLSDYSMCWNILPGTLTEMELMAGTFAVCEAAQALGTQSILFGSGAEELFIGYHKYFEAHSSGDDLDALLSREIETLPSRDLARTQKVAGHFGLEAKFPFMDTELVKAVRQVPLSVRLGRLEDRKPLLRALVKELGVPECARLRPKKAMQYSSRIHSSMLRLAKAGKIKPLPPKKPFEYD
ncbi:MAG: asparagine synthase C-terminal domain-containing protein [Candidatus Micrarchaeota archaeon]